MITRMLKLILLISKESKTMSKLQTRASHTREGGWGPLRLRLLIVMHHLPLSLVIVLNQFSDRIYSSNQEESLILLLIFRELHYRNQSQLLLMQVKALKAMTRPRRVRNEGTQLRNVK